jgi:protein-L-isoaspartate(D-aspartate) O-methyltransferase
MRTRAHPQAEFAAARAGLAAQLETTGRASPAVAAAIRAVPRHVFLPGLDPGQAYADAAVVTRSDGAGLPLSASTQPALMAVMLDQLRLEPGQRVLEIGTGTGYNAALIAHIVGDQGSVVSVDVDAGVTSDASTRLAAAGYGAVFVQCGDGAAGWPDRGPFDRIIVTAGAFDIAPAWLAQLAPGGRLVLPLAVRGIQVSACFERAGDGWVSSSAFRCSFIRMTGALAGPEAFLPLGPQPGLHALVADGAAPDPAALYRALSGPATEVAAGLRAADMAELADLDLWLTLAEPGLTRLAMLGRHEGRANPAQRRIAGLMPLGGLARTGDAGPLGVAALGFGPAGRPARTGPAGIVAAGFGPGGAGLASDLARRAASWDEAGRPGAAALRLRAYPAGSPVAAGPGELLLDRPRTRLLAGWTAAPAAR